MLMERNSVAAYDAAAVTDVDAFRRLEPEWEALWARTPESYVSETFTWTRLCLEHPPEGRSRAPFCVTVRDRGRLVALMPLAVSQIAAWRVASPLTWASEYAPFLVDPEADAEGAWRAVYEVVSKGGIDGLRLLNVVAGSPLARCLPGPLGHPLQLYVTPVMRIPAEDIADWNAFRTGKMPAKLRQSLNRRRRMVAQEGKTAVFEEVTRPAERAAIWRWMIAHKRQWAIQRGHDSSWLFSDVFERFVAAGLEALGDARRIFVLRVDDAPIAAELSSVDKARVECFMTVYDEACARFSPANLLHEHTIAWAGERGLAYDIRIGDGPDKRSWATQRSEAASYVVPLTAWGRVWATSLKAAASLKAARKNGAGTLPGAGAGGGALGEGGPGNHAGAEPTHQQL